MADLTTDIVAYDLSAQEVYKGQERSDSRDILPMLCKLKCEHMYNFLMCILLPDDGSYR
jgi:hypothetical protein